MQKEKRTCIEDIRIDKIGAIAAIIIFLLSLLPILILAKYNHSCADDYSYGLFAHRAWLETKSLWEVIKAAAEKVIECYMQWQGTFSSIFLMAIQPAVFGEKYYFITPYIMLFMLTASTLSFLKVIIMDYLKGTSFQFVIVGFLLTTVSIQLMLSPVEGIYWYNGAVHYVFMYSCMLFMISAFLQYLKGKKYRFLLISCVLAVIVGGGNYITALTSVLCICIIAGFLAVYRKKGYSSLGILLFCAMAGIVISGCAPGNTVRQQHFTQPSIMEAILFSFRNAVKFIWDHFHILYFLVLIFLIPFIWKFVSTTDIKFKLPFLIPVISYCLVAAMFAPTEYTMGIAYVGRTGNVILLMAQLLGVLNEIYLLGWVAQRQQEKQMKWITKIERLPEKAQVVFCVALTFVAILVVSVTYKDKIIYTSISAAQSLYYGEAAAYDAQIQQRLQILENSDVEEAELQALQTRPYLLYFDDITVDAGDWRNVFMAEYFGKKSVVLIP